MIQNGKGEASIAYISRKGKYAVSRKRKKGRSGKDTIILILAFIAVASIAVAIWAITTGESEESSSSATSDEPSQREEITESLEKLTDTIDLPGYSWIPLVSGKLEQEQTFPNPPQNFCYIRVLLRLEDGTLLWTSELVPPGERTAPVVLSQTLAPGEYKNAILKYECFRMDDDLSPLNGGEIKLTLKVK